ncbi:pilus assembly protein TadG-related protein [Streptomyces sp. NPDC088097]|uniref:pilus assembly protein TadG-related protein n=1 Tax=Streptomyces sp. NPDC088097 TaxID=3365823 RepID=UPI00381BD18A
MIRRLPRDSGQAFPLYVVAVVAMLFAALAFFAFGQAAAVRSDSQGAADAAALAAAQDARDHLDPALDLALLKPEGWEDLIEGGAFDEARACSAAEDFAGRNNSTATCTSRALRFTVDVITDGTVGDSVIPGTDSVHAKAKAIAEIVPRCELVSAPSVPSSPEPAPTTPVPATPAPTASVLPGAVVIKCRGGAIVKFDPTHPDPWKVLARSLFDVRLAG